jgi:hypothetical protein
LVYVIGGAAFTQVEFSAFCATAYPVGWCAGVGELGGRRTSTSVWAGWTVDGGIETRIIVLAWSRGISLR